MTSSFGDALAGAFSRHGQLCVGIDPHPFLLAEWRLDDSAAGVREFGLRVVDATVGSAAIVKPQVAFFERFGSAGYAALEEVIRVARESGLLVIADAKRGDIGTSAEAYGRTWLEPGSPLESDAVTMSPYLGFGSLDAVLSLAESAGKGVFVLAATSNPEGETVQKATLTEGSSLTRSVARGMIDDVKKWNAQHAARAEASTSAIGSIGVVLGATVDLPAFGIALDDVPAPAMPVLAPGFGSQGAALVDAPRLFGGLATATIVSESRSVLGAGPDGIRAAVATRASEVQNIFVR